MDFSQFDSRTASDIGAEMTIRHPVSGEPILHDGEPCVAIVRGAEGPAAQAALRAARKRRSGGDQADEADRTLEDVHEALVDAAAPLILGFRHVSLGGRGLTAADARAFLNLNMLNGREGEQSFAEQVLAFAGKRANFLPKPVIG